MSGCPFVHALYTHIFLVTFFIWLFIYLFILISFFVSYNCLCVRDDKIWCCLYTHYTISVSILSVDFCTVYACIEHFYSIGNGNQFRDSCMVSHCERMRAGILQFCSWLWFKKKVLEFVFVDFGWVIVCKRRKSISMHGNFFLKIFRVLIFKFRMFMSFSLQQRNWIFNKSCNSFLVILDGNWKIKIAEINKIKFKSRTKKCIVITSIIHSATIRLIFGVISHCELL